VNGFGVRVQQFAKLCEDKAQLVSACSSTDVAYSSAALAPCAISRSIRVQTALFINVFIQYFHSNLKLIPESEHPLNSRYCIQLNSAAGAAGMMKKRKSH
jgi:hypothetical protein